MPKTFSVMTYNVHSCIGTDRKLSPLRIAEVIDRCNPDIVALQELDAGLPRTQMIDQAHLIAMTLEMSFHFHSSIHLKEGGYGNAVLSRGDVRLIKAGAVPTDPLNPSFERRGAVWAEVTLRGHTIQVLGTHFGLNRGERVKQARAMTGHEWLEHPECVRPVVLCGDFNAMAGSYVYRLLTRQLHDVQRGVKGRLPRGTWPSQLPFIRIDHMFASRDLKVRQVWVPRTPLTRVASDHLPLVVTLELP
ncbi:endonuclease/exonuclease/phosphatase family protein [Geomonas nitrogeniifigens]|uniref:Endonuclease/exonuclease/phosphatase family protein n=1 Tax=Geomonas diazotrophica TaxID=2843197 RepID=A0ABX8JND8_9BACT|nr:endonuclease/exonuclease/phosphatase family protein [Geomonas nitrogeniifigens]QWV98902.1 endonuclease/exonuclease/phosphatase family protein [Geomonas nitrogeniifigens]